MKKDCPVSKFRELRGRDISNEEIRSLLQDILDDKLTLAGLGAKARQIKDLKQIQQALKNATNLSSWTAVREK